MRQTPRVRLDRPARLITEDGTETAALILDISAEGFRLEHADDLHAGDRVILVTDRGERIAVSIKWSVGKEAGGTFDEEPSALL